MKKRILSMTLILSIVASLFAVANFGAIAKDKLVAGTDYTLSGYNNKSNFNLDPKENLLNNVTADNVYWYNVDERDTAANGGASYIFQPTKVTKPGWADNLGLATVETNTPSAAQPAFQITNSLGLELFIDFDDKGTEATNDDTPIFDTPNVDLQWAQTNYTLPERSVITDVTLTRYEASDNVGLYAPTAYQYIFSDTPGGLISGVGATVVEVNHTASTIKNVTTVTLNKPVTAKYMAIRMLQPYNIYATEAQKNTLKGKAATQKFYQWNRLDVHGTKAAEMDYTVSGFNNQNQFNLDPKDSLLNGLSPDAIYWYNVDEADTAANGGATYTNQATLVTNSGWTANTGFATREDNTPSAPQPAFYTSSSLQLELFFQRSADNKTITSIDTPSEKQWVQANYTLPERSEITDVTLSCFENKDTVSQYTPTTYQYIFSDTPGGLISGVGATTITVDHSESTIKNITTVTLNKVVKAKYMAIRMYQHYNTLNPNASTVIGNGVGSRWMKWNRLDVHGQKTDELPYTISGYNNRNNYDVDPEYNLLDDIPTHEAYYYNTDANDPEIYIKSTPTKSSKDWFQHTDFATLTENKVGSLQPAFMLCNGLGNEMFTQYGSDGKITKLDTPDVNKQWFQANYALAAEADINEVILADLNKTDDTISQWAPQSYQYIFANTEEALLTGEGVTVVNVDHTKDTIKNITKVAFSTPVRAKFVAVRFYQPYNSFGSYNWTTRAHTGLWFGWNRLDLHGVYVSPADASVAVATEEGVPSTLISKADAVYTGPKDDNGNYAAGSVKVTATESYEDRANLKLYTFKGWYNGETIVSAKAEYTYDLAGGDIALTAKYDVKETTVKYTLSFIDATKNVIGTIVVEEGKTPSKDDVKAINAKVKDIYGYNVFVEDDMVVWDGEVFEAVTADNTFYARYKAVDINTAVTIYKLDNKSEYEKQDTQKFDTAITLTCEGALSWTDAEDKVLVAAPTGTLYACGTEMNLYPVSTQLTADAVTFVGKEMKDGKFTVFAHAAPTAEVKAYGIIFASNTYKLNYDAQGENKGDMFTLKDTAAINKENPSLKVSEVKVTTEGVVDFMATLTGCGGKVRHARAYVVYSDDTVVYSDVIVTNN